MRPESVDPNHAPDHAYQLRIVQEVLLALLAAEPAHAYRLRAEVALALGPLAAAMNVVAAAAAGLADPVAMVDRQRGDLLVGVREAQRAALAEPEGSVAVLLLEGVVLRLRADLRGLEDCAQFWNSAKGRGVR